jgi:hypothetical protein
MVLPSAASSDPSWFTDFILFPDDSDDPGSQADATSVSETSSSARVDTASDMTVDHLLTLPSRPFPMLPELGVFDCTDTQFGQRLHPEGNDGLDLDFVTCSPSRPSSEWNTAELTPALYAGRHSGSASGADNVPFSLDHFMPTQNVPLPFKRSVPRMRSFKCTTCHIPFSSDSRLRFVPHIYVFQH